jgi:hypothetical protein
MVITHPCTIDAAWPNFRHGALNGADLRLGSGAGEHAVGAGRSRAKALAASGLKIVVFAQGSDGCRGV